jgi:protein TonB
MRPRKSQRANGVRSDVRSVAQPLAPRAAIHAPGAVRHALLASAVTAALIGCADADSGANPGTGTTSAVAAGAAMPVTRNTPAPAPTATVGAGDTTARDPFAGVDPNQSDVLRNIARLDPSGSARTGPRSAAAPSAMAAPAAASPGNNTPEVVQAAPSPVAATTAESAGFSAAPAPSTSIASPATASAVEPAAPSQAPAPSTGTASPEPAAESAPSASAANASAAAAAPAPIEPPPAALAAAPAAAATAAAQRRAISRPLPPFPRDALREGITEGRVAATLSVAADGRVTDVNVLSAAPNRRFARAAQQALREWRYEPAAAASTVQVELEFRVE